MLNNDPLVLKFKNYDVNGDGKKDKIIATVDTNNAGEITNVDFTAILSGQENYSGRKVEAPIHTAIDGVKRDGNTITFEADRKYKGKFDGTTEQVTIDIYTQEIGRNDEPTLFSNESIAMDLGSQNGEKAAKRDGDTGGVWVGRYPSDDNLIKKTSFDVDGDKVIMDVTKTQSVNLRVDASNAQMNHGGVSVPFAM